MKIAVTSTGPMPDDDVEARFGRCAYFLIVDTETMQYEAIENPNIALGGGAGIQSAQLISEKGVTTVLTGNCGPNAFSVFGQAGVQVVVGVSGVVRNAVEQFKTGALASASEPNVASHFGVNAVPADPTPTGQPKTSPLSQGGGRGIGRGMGGGRGMGPSFGRGGGRGRGMGRGMGRGGGMRRGMGMPSAGSVAGFPQGAGAQMNPERELALPKKHAQMLELEKDEIEQTISKLETGRRLVALVLSEKCAGCGICTDVCPENAIEIDDHAVVNPESCIGCGACISECPNDAIILTSIKNV